MVLDHLIQSIETHKDKVALCCDDVELTYEDLGEVVLNYSKDFVYKDYPQLEVKGSAIEFIISFWSALLAGSIPIITKEGETLSDIEKLESDVYISHTSGTTGKPSFIHKSNELMDIRMEMSKEYLPFTVGEETLLSLAPMYHSMGLDHGMIQSVMNKSTFVYISKITPRKIFSNLSKYKPTIIQLGSPRNIDIILNHKEFDPSLFDSVNYAYSSGEPVPKQFKDRWMFATGIPLLEGYGCTEAGMITMESIPQRLGSMGKPIDPEGFRIVDGEIQVRGDYVISDGWYATGDLAEQDEDGFVYVSGRK